VTQSAARPKPRSVLRPPFPAQPVAQADAPPARRLASTLGPVSMKTGERVGSAALVKTGPLFEVPSAVVQRPNSRPLRLGLSEWNAGQVRSGLSVLRRPAHVSGRSKWKTGEPRVAAQLSNFARTSALQRSCGPQAQHQKPGTQSSCGIARSVRLRLHPGRSAHLPFGARSWPNPSVNATANGAPPGPRGRCAYHPPRGPGVTPSSARYLKR
jgi:ribosomal protein L37E